MNRILALLLGLPVLVVSMFAVAQTADSGAKPFHYLPMLVNGGGFQSTVLVTNVADGANRCRLELLPNGLSASGFEAHDSLSWDSSAATFTLSNSGARVSIAGRDLSTPETYGSATLDCDMPAAARVLVTLRSGNAVEAAALLPGAQMGATFKFPVLPRFGGYLLAVHNGQDSNASCRVELADESGSVVDQKTLAVAGNASVFRDLSELAQTPADFAGGSVTLSCDGQVAATGMLVGAAMSGLPPAVLAKMPEEENGSGAGAGLAPENAAAFDRLVVGKRFVSAADSRYYIEFPSAGQFVEVGPGVSDTGTYSYGNTGPNTGTLTLNYSDGDVCTSQLTLTSATSASSQFTCTGGESGGGTWRLEDSQPSTGGGDGGDTETPQSPANVRYVRDGSTAVVSWDAAQGAEYYKIYYDDFWSSGCRLNSSGSPSFCDELAANVAGTSYTHASPDDDRNYYWVVACNDAGCSEIGADPAEFIDTRPANSPRNASYVRDGSTTVLTWDAVAEADYYKIYHDDFWSSGCRLNSSGSPSFCDELAANVAGTSYTHASPDDDDNYYWVVACNAGGCTEIGADPAEFVDTRPAAPQNVRASRNGSSVALSWDAVAGADYYKIYHDDFSSSNCRLNSSGSPSFCDELAVNVTGTSYTHASPDDDRNYYWVVACNTGGCSDIDSANPVEPGAGGGDTGGGNDGGGDPGACQAELVINPGESCTYKGADFSVDGNGGGSIVAAGILWTNPTGIDLRNVTVNGVLWNFYATRNNGSNSWTVHVAD